MTSTTPQRQAMMQYLRDQLVLEKPDWNAVRDTLQRNPMSASDVLCDDGSNVLHLACDKNAPFSVVQLIIRQHPVFVTQKDHDGNLPLHYACRVSHSLKVIEVLVQQRPDTLKERNNDNDLPLHVAISFNQSLEVIQWLVQQHPEAVKEKSKERGDLPLHCACISECSLEMIQWLVQQYPGAATAKNNRGFLPLHIVCSTEQSLEVIELLVQQHPDAVKEKTIDGELPLHLAIRFNQSLEVIQLLVQQHPNTLKEKIQKSGNLPLHCACKYNRSLEMIQWLVQQCPNAIKEKNNAGFSPLHIICSNKQALEVIELLVQHRPDTVKEKTKEGDLPLHRACRNNQSLNVIKFLVQKYRNALKEKCGSHWLPLHVACRHRQSLDVIQWLVQQYPNAINEKTQHDELPLHLACAAKASLQVIQWLVQHNPNHLTEGCHGLREVTPLALAKLSADDLSPDPETVQWLEAVASGQINPRKSPPALPSFSPKCGEKKLNGSVLPPTNIVEKEQAKLPAVAANNDAITMDRRSVLAVLVGKKKITAVSPSYVESIRTEEIIGNGFFGTVYQGTDIALNRSFAIKAINTDILLGGHSGDAQTDKEAFLTEMKACSLFRHPNIESLYAYASPDDVRACCYLVCELAEKGSLDIFLKRDLGSERLSLFLRRIQIALDVMTAIQFLHVGNDQISSSFHGNIKSSTIVLKRDFTAQLIDCGLAKFVVGANESLLKKARAYLCPYKGSDGVPCERSCDILSFGVVLAELLTGKLQIHKDEYGKPNNFETLYVKDNNDVSRDIKKDLDPALGYDTLAPPKYVQDFADLAICCLQPKLKDRPAGEAVMVKLGEIWSRCSRGISLGDSMPGTFELKSSGKCQVCRTFPPVSSQGVCAVCKSAEERRAQMSFRGEIRRQFAATKGKLDGSLPLLRRLDMRLNNPVPRLFIIVPLCIKSGMSDPKEWLRSHHRVRYCLYFVCVHSLKAIAPPVPIIVTKCWFEKVAPVLAMSLYLLQLGVKADDCIELNFGRAQVTLKLNSAMIAKILDAVSYILAETGNSDLLVRLRGNEELDAEDIRHLNDEAYELVVETAGEDRGWRDRMEPVRKEGCPKIFWVSKEVANDTSNGYEIVRSS